MVIIGRLRARTFGANNINSPRIRFYWSNCCLISDNTKSSKLAVFLSLWPLARCLPGRWTNRIAKRSKCTTPKNSLPKSFWQIEKFSNIDIQFRFRYNIFLDPFKREAGKERGGAGPLSLVLRGWSGRELPGSRILADL